MLDNRQSLLNKEQTYKLQMILLVTSGNTIAKRKTSKKHTDLQNMEDFGD